MRFDYLLKHRNKETQKVFYEPTNKDLIIDCLNDATLFIFYFIYDIAIRNITWSCYKA